MWLILLPFHRWPRRFAAAGDDPRPPGGRGGPPSAASRWREGERHWRRQFLGHSWLVARCRREPARQQIAQLVID